MIRKTALVLVLLAVTACGGNPNVRRTNGLAGAGATFPAPLYARWAESYHRSTNIAVNYQPIGSGGGIRQIKAGTVDFGATDKPLAPTELAHAGLYQFPTVIGGVVPVINLPGISAGQVKLTGPLLADIFAGTITHWRAPPIVALNPGMQLPDLPITVVHRSDGSGTSFLFTSYLAGQSANWRAKVGASDAVNWPVGIGGKGNDGVAAFVKQTVGAIGYVEFAYVRQNQSSYVLLRNRAGHYPAPDERAFAAAASGADWTAPGNYLLLLDEPGANSWPITGATFILVHRRPSDPVRSAGVLKFFDWAYRNGDREAAALGYVPLPDKVKATMRAQWANVVTARAQPAEAR